MIRYNQPLPEMDAAKQARTSSKRLLTLAQNQVLSAIDQDFADEIIASRLLKAERMMDDVMEKHQQYLGHKYPDDDKPISADDEDWFQSIATEYDQMEIKAHQKLKGTSKVEAKIESKSSDQLLIVKRQCDYDEMLLESALEHLRECIEDEMTSVETIREAQKEAKSELDKYCEMMRKISISDPGQSSEDDMRKVKSFVSTFNSIKLEVGKVIASKSQAKSSNHKSHDRSIFKLEKMKLPTFDGDLRKYPRFLSDFKKFILPNIESTDSASYVLRTCLTGTALESVRNVDDDVEQMLELLQEKFGRASKLADTIMNDIKHIKPVNDGDDKAFLKMVNLLENGYNDLRRIGLDREISNSTIASMVEEKLPKTIKAQWCLRMIVDKIDDTDKFPSLITFLLTHKQAVEYGNNELRTSQKSSNNGNQLPNRIGATNFGQSPNGSSKSPRETCWIHTDSKGNHPIWQCPEFIKMTVTERKALVLKNKACTKCLLMKCPGVNAKGQCWLKFRCKEDGCGKEHNQLLHEDCSNVDGHIGQVNHTTYDFVGESNADVIGGGAALLPLQ